MLTFYALPLSTYCTKVRIVLRIKDIPYREVMPHGGHYSTDEYRQHMPPGTLPSMEQDGFKLFDSQAIIEYLEDKWPDPPMRAKNIEMRARQRAIAQFHNTRLEPAIRVLFPVIKAGGNHDPMFVDNALDAFQMQLGKPATVIEPNPFLGQGTPCLADCGFPSTLRMAEDLFLSLGGEVRFGNKISEWLQALEQHSVIADEVGKNRAAIKLWLNQF